MRWGNTTAQLVCDVVHIFTVGAEFRSFFVGIPEAVRKMHDAVRVTTAPEAAGMPYFMYCFLDSSVMKKHQVLAKTIKFLPEPRKGNSGNTF